MQADLKRNRVLEVFAPRLLLFLSMLMGPRIAQAANNSAPDRAAREREAKRACLTEDPARGVAILTDLYLDTNNPTFIYNQGRCFEQNNRCDSAITRFREYLVKAKNLSASERADVDKHIAACQSYLNEKAAQAQKPEIAQDPPAPKTKAEPPVPNESASPAAPPKPAPSENLTAEGSPPPVAEPAAGSAGSGLRIAGLVVASAGAASALTGLYFNLRANKLSSDVEKTYNPNADSKRKNYETWGWIAYGTGAACAVGGAIVYFVGRNMGADSVAFTPALAPGMAGATLTGTF